jgi:RND family efflux transporter MFP subunit
VLAGAGYTLARGRQGVEVRVATVELRGVGGGAPSAVISANGYVVARTKASISSKITGRLEFLGVSEGDKVRSGEVLARLESADYRAALDERVSQLALARATLTELVVTRDQLRRDLTRLEKLREQDLVADQEAEQLRARLAEAEAREKSQEAQVGAMSAAVEVARANLENTNIRAPFDGTILRKDAEVGELVAPSVAGGGLTRGAVVTLADLSTLEVEVDVNEAYIAQVLHGQAASLTLDAYPSVAFRGEVRQVMPTADRQRATVQVKVRILDQDPRILPEMGARVSFLEAAGSAGGSEPSRPRAFVPATAVQQDQGEDIVWIVRNERIERRVIDAGPVSGGEREVRSGLTGGEQIIVEGSGRLAEGARVKIRP